MNDEDFISYKNALGFITDSLLEGDTDLTDLINLRDSLTLDEFADDNQFDAEGFDAALNSILKLDRMFRGAPAFED